MDNKSKMIELRAFETRMYDLIFLVLAFSISRAVIWFSRYNNWLDNCAFQKAKAETEAKAAAEKAAADAKVAFPENIRHWKFSWFD